jgi:autotransporter-associated beta strand protein
MKNPAFIRAFRPLLALVSTLVLAVLAALPVRAAQLTNFLNSSLPSGTYDFLGAYWNSNSETATPSVAFVAPGGIVIGQNPGDFNGETLIIPWDISGTTKIITSAGTNITIGATNVMVTFNGTQNNYIDAACTITVAAGSTLIEADTHDQGLNFNNEAVTFAGGGTIIFATSVGGNSSALLTENMPGGTVVLEQTNLSGTDYLLTGGYTLTSGALVFGTATGAGGAFSNFAAGKLFKISGGSIDNTSGSAQTLGMGAGTYSLGGNFTFTGSSSLNFNTNAVALTANVIVTNLSNTLTMGGAISGAGFGLTASGPGALALAGANTYTGATIVNGGALALAGSASLSSSSTIGISNATFSLAGQLATTNVLGLTNALLVLTVPVNFTTNVVVGALNLGGTTNTINIAQLPPFTSYPTTIPLISYSNTLGLTNLVLGPLPASTGAPYVGHLTTNMAHLVTLVMTAGPAPARTLTWIGTDTSDGGTTAWDVATSYNWTTNAPSVVPTTYNQLDFVRFDDSTLADGSPTPGQVQLTTELTPSVITVSNNAVTYTFNSSGYLADPSSNAPMQLVKQGTGTVIMDNYSPNTYSGGTVISAGTFQVGNNGDGDGSLGAGPVVVGGTLSLQSGYNTITNPISGSGTIAQYGSGTVTLSGALSGSLSIFEYGSGTLNLGGASAAFTGAVTVVSNAVLQAGSASAFGAASRVNVQNGGILDLNGFSLGAVPVFAQGAGNIPNGGGTGAIDNSSATAPPDDLGLEFVTLTGNTTFSTSGGRWDLRSPGNDAGVVGSSAATSTAALSTGGQPYNLSYQGPGFLGIVSAWVDPALANIDIVAGTLDYEGGTTGLGNPANSVTVESGAIFELWNTSNALNKVVVVNDNATVFSGSGATNTITGPVILTNAGSFCNFQVASNTTLNLQGTVSGQGTLLTPPSATYIGTLILNNGNTFSGGIQENAGTIIINGNNSLVTNNALIESGTFIVNGVFGGDTTNENSSILTGSGTNLGALDVNGTLTPGGVGTIGTFTVGAPAAASSLTLESGASVSFELGYNNTPGGGINDLVVVNGNLTFNAGSLMLNPFTIVQEGVPYVIITYSGALTVNSLPSVSTSSSYTFTLNTSVPGQISVVASGSAPPVWNGGDGPSDTDWSQPGNWGGVTIGPGDNLYFAGTTSLVNTNDTAVDTQYGNITFIPGAGPFVLYGNNIEMGSGILINDSSNPQTVELGVDFASSFAFNGGSSPAAPLIIGGGLNINNSANDTSVYLNGYGILSNNLVNNAGAGFGSNIITMTNNSANWTMLDNPTSTPISLPWGLEISAGTFTYGSATSAPNFTSTPATGAVNGADDTFIGDIAGTTATFNMVNGTLTLAARIDLGEIAGSTGIFNQIGGTINLTEMQTANESGIAFVNISGGLMNIAGNPYYNATRTNATLTMTGGALVCTTMDVCRCVNPGYPGTVNLSGGTLTCSRVGTATSAASATATGNVATFDFNGGTLIASASSTTFYQGSTTGPVVPITSIVKSNGAIINDGGFAISILEPLQHDPTLGTNKDGGLTKLGAGTNTLGKQNTYTGPTVISAGTLALSSPAYISDSVSIDIAAGATLNAGGTLILPSGQTLEGGGSVAGNLTSSAGSTVTPGSNSATGTLTVSGALVLQGATYMKLNGAANDELVASSSILSYGGSLIVTNLPGNTLAAGDTFTLFNAASYANSFASITLPALGAGLVWQTNLSVNGTISVVSATSPTPVINSFLQSGGNLIFSGTNGSAGGTYYVLTSTNLTVPLASWTRLSTNTFGAAGTFSVTNPIVPGVPASFFILEIP